VKADQLGQCQFFDQFQIRGGYHQGTEKQVGRDVFSLVLVVDTPFRSGHDPGHYLQKRGLPTPVGADKSIVLAGFEPKMKLPEYPLSAKFAAQVLCFNNQGECFGWKVRPKRNQTNVGMTEGPVEN
jgi:hypothetical protein